MSEPSPATSAATPLSREMLLLASTFGLAVAGLVYELIAGTVSSYLLGDSVYQFSIVIGLFMSAMGLGAYLSRFVEKLEQAFVSAQIALGLLGGFSASALFAAFIAINNYEAILWFICVASGILIGLEIPLITRILNQQRALRSTISNVLTADYAGALAAAILFPILLVPQLGLMQTSLLFGTLNAAVALLACWLFRHKIQSIHWMAGGAAALALIVGFLSVTSFERFLETRLYEAEVIHDRTTPYQRIVVTSHKGRIALYLNGRLQFDSIDEYRYHEALVHPIMTRAQNIDNVLILGGGDGMAVRELRRYPGIQSITLVDLDPEVTSLFKDHPRLKTLNEGALEDPRLEIVNDDAWRYLESHDTLFDVVIIDLPDPHDLALSKLYSREFYFELSRHLGADSLIVTQATSPLFARKAFWSIETTLALTAHGNAPDAGLQTLPYHTHIPSFGEWGFIIAGARLAKSQARALPENLRYLTNTIMADMSNFPPDMTRLDVEANSIIDHPLVAYYEEGWSTWFQ